MMSKQFWCIGKDIQFLHCIDPSLEGVEFGAFYSAWFNQSVVIPMHASVKFRVTGKIGSIVGSLRII
jgi:hypothetical protein